jgi:hypothetical protein
LEGSGFVPADYAQEPFELWPENWPAFELFCSLSTQWRTGVGGRTGLDYNVLFRLLDDRQLERPEWQQLFRDVQFIEGEALTFFNQQ